MPDKEKKKSIFSLLLNSRDRKSGPAPNTTGVVSHGECTLRLFPQALTLHAARSPSSEDPSPSESQHSLRDSAGSRPQEDGTLTVFRYLIDLTRSSRCFPG